MEQWNSVFYKIPAKKAERDIYRENSVPVFHAARKALKIQGFLWNSGF